MNKAFQKAVAAGIRVWVILVILSPGFAGVIQSEPVREALKESEWFDYERDDYHRYDPEDIKIPEDNWNCRPRSTEMDLPDGAGVAFFLNGLVYLVLAAVVVLILYLIYRVIQERSTQEDLIEDLAALTIDHAELPAELAREAGMREPLNSKRLREMIDAAFASGDLRAACIYMYLFALLRLSAMGLIELKNDQTARDYARQIERNQAGSAVTVAPAILDTFNFPAVTRLFEYALYRGHLPDDAGAESVMALWRGLQIVPGNAANAGGAA